MARLFEDIQNPNEDAEQGGGAAAAGGHVVGVAVNANLWKAFDYIWPESLGEPHMGSRVRVPFGRGDRKTLGFVVDTLRRNPARKLKAVSEVIDAEPQLDETLYKLAEWMSDYYLTPLGMTLAAMVPSAVGKHADKTETVVYLASERHDWPASLGARQKRVLDELYEARSQGVEPLAMGELMRHSGATRESIKRLTARRLVRTDSRPVTLPELFSADAAGGDPFELNADQQAVMTALGPKLADKKFSATLLYGVTGSGKTEVYVRAIRRVVEAGRQAILMVPEIALATQTLQRLLERLPRVAVLHSGLTETQRAFYYQQIRDGHAAVVVGPRSAIFAPARKLGLIIVDEEHEPTYKQDNAPRYHGRDVAVMRASIAAVPIVLGSATPSLESLQNARQGRYDLLRLPRRVKNLPMPKLEIVSLRKEMQPDRIELIGRTLTQKMAAALNRDEQIILLMNRRGYASYVFCPSCKWIMSCENCSRAMVFHRATQLAMCHYCQHTAPLPTHCQACGKKLLLFGYGIQRIEGELASKFPDARVARVDSDTMTSPRQFKKVFDGFSSGEIDILLGTQMVGKGLDFPKVSLVGVASADTSLTIPDFRAAERTFQLVVQVAGRAGRSDRPGEVVVQTLHEGEPAIVFATSHDYDGFAEHELKLRAAASLPPFSRVVRFIVRHEQTLKAEAAAGKLAAELREILPKDQVTMFGPMAAGVPRIKNQFRFQIILTCRRAGLIQQLLAPRMEALCKDISADVIADVDPVSLI